MAVNIIDAFIVTFGLDARGYKSGERELRDSLRDTRENAKKTFDDVEDRGKKASITFRRVRNEVVGLVLAFAGARSATDFASNLLTGEAAAGRLGETIGLSTSRLIAWQEAVKQVGGSENEATAALQGIASAIQSYKLTGTTGNDADFRGLGITNSDLLSKDPSEILLKIAAAGERLSKPEFAARLQRIGIPQSTIYLLEQGREKLEQQLAASEKLANVTDRDAKAAQELDRRLALLATTIKGAARPYLTQLVDAFISFVERADKAGILIPLITGALGALAIATIAATAPWIALAAAIGGAVYAFEKWQNVSADEAKKTGKDEGWGIPGLFWVHREGAVKGPGSSAPQGDAPNWVTNQRRSLDNYISRLGGGNRGAYIESFLQRAGITPEQARGVTAGLHAESGLNPNAVNPTSGAYGIGQWLGPRKRALFARYGRNPSLDQQLAFLVSELQGGDRGGPSVLRQTTADHALLAFVANFLRPGPGALGDIRRGRSYLGSAGALAGNRARSGVTIGSVNVYPRSGDPQVIARETADAIRKRAIVTQADGGVAP